MAALQSHYYHLFGWSATLYMLMFYLIMTVLVFPESKDKGRIIPHVLMLKTVALVVYPSYS